MKKSVLSIIASIFLITSCATGSAILVGKAKEPISYEDVIILAEIPADAEIIAIVEASSDSGWTATGDYKNAVIECRKQAAKYGANAVVIESMTQNTESYVKTGSIIIPSTSHGIKGKAIYIK